MPGRASWSFTITSGSRYVPLTPAATMRREPAPVPRNSAMPSAACPRSALARNMWLARKSPAGVKAPRAGARPGSFTFASAGGVGTNTHMSAERFRASAGIDAVHVPLKGGPEAVTEVMAGRVDFFFGPVGLVLSHVRAGTLAALAVNSPKKRSPALPDVPTTLEAGFAESDYPIWIGMFAPTKTPRAVVDKLNGEIFKAVQSPKVQDKLAAIGTEPMIMKPAEFDAHVKEEIALNATLVKAAGIKAD